jgi:chorismate-pyruvate lyase
MTVTVEAFHGCPVTVQVLQTLVTPTHYSRRILLRRESDDRVVQFGIVRLAIALLDEEVRREIESQSAPLGRILIEHNVLRDVRLLSLWRIAPGSELCGYFQIRGTDPCFGRTALIYCDGVPAVELLEILPPT